MNCRVFGVISDRFKAAIAQLRRKSISSALAYEIMSLILRSMPSIVKNALHTLLKCSRLVPRVG